jgi:DNA-binding response OmpR family regulator
MHVLLIDDDARLRQVLARLLHGQGFGAISEASDGEEALAILADSHPDLIVTDCQMPRMDGISFVRALRARGDNTPVLMLSGQHEAHFVVSAIKAGVSNYLPKPINPEALFEKIWQTLGASPAAI